MESTNLLGGAQFAVSGYKDIAEVHPGGDEDDGCAEQRQVEHSPGCPGQMELNGDQEDEGQAYGTQQFDQRRGQVGAVGVINCGEVVVVGLVEAACRRQNSLLHQVRRGVYIVYWIGLHPGPGLPEQAKISWQIALHYENRAFLLAPVGHIFARGDQRMRYSAGFFVDGAPG